jgi:Mg-chelatase subunit ChlD
LANPRTVAAGIVGRVDDGVDRFGQESVDNVVIVLDASGSMSGQLRGSRTEKISAAKAALKQVLKSVPETTRIGLLVFSAQGAQTDWFYPLVRETM